MQPVAARFQRPWEPLKRVTDRGVMSMRQNDDGGAPMARTIAARMIVGWVTMIDSLRCACAAVSHASTRAMRLAIASPPCGTEVGSFSHAETAVGS